MTKIRPEKSEPSQDPLLPLCENPAGIPRLPLEQLCVSVPKVCVPGLQILDWKYKNSNIIKYENKVQDLTMDEWSVIYLNNEI